jgi:hypothetical protein
VQQLSLLYLMRREMKEVGDLEFERFKGQMVAAHPERASEILAALEVHEDEPEPTVTDQGFEADERGFMLTELRKMGFSVSDD